MLYYCIAVTDSFSTKKNSVNYIYIGVQTYNKIDLSMCMDSTSENITIKSFIVFSEMVYPIYLAN